MHIADVSNFIKEGSALDLEARARATSVYMVQQVVPMLPRLLCEQLCSLNAAVDRYAFSAIFILNDVGEVEGRWFGRTVMRSCARLTYNDAQYIIEGKPVDEWNVTTHNGVDKTAVAQDIANLDRYRRSEKHVKYKTPILLQTGQAHARSSLRQGRAHALKGQALVPAGQGRSARVVLDVHPQGQQQAGRRVHASGQHGCCRANLPEVKAEIFVC